MRCEIINISENSFMNLSRLSIDSDPSDYYFIFKSIKLSQNSIITNKIFLTFVNGW